MAFDAQFCLSNRTSALHAVAALVAGLPAADQKLAQALAGEARDWSEYLAPLGASGTMLWEHLLGCSLAYEAAGDLAQVALAKTFGAGKLTEFHAPLAGRLRQLQTAFDQAYPDASDELELRSGPMREQWEARGPGLIAAVGRETEPELLVERADVILVQPILGGGGAAHPLYNSLRIEAVLANPIDALPEVVRLGWLVAQLNLDVPMFQGNLRADETRQLGAVALIPAVLAAAQEVELVRASDTTLALALTHWTSLIEIPPGIDAEKLSRWRDVYQSGRTPWAAALEALARM